MMVGWLQKLSTKKMTPASQLWTFSIYAATFQQHLHIEHFISRLIRISGLALPIMISLIKGYQTKRFKWWIWNHNFVNFMDVFMSWLNFKKCLLHRWRRICSNGNHNFVLYSLNMTYRIRLGRVCTNMSFTKGDTCLSALASLPKIPRSALFLVGFVLLGLQLSIQCFVIYCLSFFLAMTLSVYDDLWVFMFLWYIWPVLYSFDC